MKKTKALLITVLLLTGSCFQIINAQQTTTSEQNKEAELQQLIDQQKKSLSEQKSTQDKANKELLDQKIKMEKSMRDLEVQVETDSLGGNVTRIYHKRGGRQPFTVDEPFVWSGPDVSYFGHSFGGDEERTTWDFSKSVRENTFTRDYSFDVEKSVSTVVMSVMGDCKAGDIHIKIIMPGGKSYSDIIIDEFGNLNWRKSFNISETENQDKTGVWKFQIASNKATGYFKISLQTY